MGSANELTHKQVPYLKKQQLFNHHLVYHVFLKSCEKLHFPRAQTGFFKLLLLSNQSSKTPKLFIKYRKNMYWWFSLFIKKREALKVLESVRD